MAKQRVIAVLIACLTLAVFTGRLLSRRRIPITPPPPESLRGLTDAEAKEFMKKWFADLMLQRRVSNYEHSMAKRRQMWKNELRLGEAQWRLVEPKYKRQIQLMLDSWSRPNSGIREGEFYWVKRTEDGGVALAKKPAELTEAERIVDRLIDLLRRQDSTDEELRKQIDALQRAREEARRELRKAKRELAAALTTPRQEAIFLLFGYID